MNEENYFTKHQYELPRKLFVYAENFPNVSFVRALKLYSLSVEEIILVTNEDNLFSGSLSCGRGLILARNLWLEKMKKAEEKRY